MSTNATPPPSYTPPTSSCHAGHASTSRPSTSSLPRSSKRAKSTSSPHTHAHAQARPSSSRSSSSFTGPYPPASSRQRVRPVAVSRRLVEPSPREQRGAYTSPFKSPELPDHLLGLNGRRREMSVPLLSQELSHVSLSHHPQTNGMLTAHFTTPTIPHSQRTPPAPTCLPHAGPSRTPLASPLSKTHTYPSTAPLPHLPSFLGSPFSTKTARGRYVYQAVSPSHQATKGAMTEGPSQGYFDQPPPEWLEGREWMADVAPESHNPYSSISRRGSNGLPLSTSRMRRDTNGSTSSMDDFSGSGTSSASLLSLARSSMDHPTRPNIITVWNEESYKPFEEEEDNETPSRQLFKEAKNDGTLHIQGKKSRMTPTVSPIIAKYDTRTPTVADDSLSRALSSAHTPTADFNDARAIETDLKSSRSPFSSFIPRLLSSKKKLSVQGADNRQRSPMPNAEDEDTLTDTEGLAVKSASRSKIFWDKSKVLASRNPMEGGDFEPSRGLGIGLGIRRSSADGDLKINESTIDLSRSLSSESGDDFGTSPLRQMSMKTSTSLFVKTTPLSPGPLGQQKGSSQSAFLARRKTLAPQEPSRNLGKASSPAISTVNRPGRPARPFLRRGITDPVSLDTPVNANFLTVDSAFHTPTAALFGDIKPSPAAFASTGLVKKKSGITAAEIPKFGTGVIGTESEPVGPAKRKEAAAQHGIGTEPNSPLSPIKPLSRPAFASILTSSTVSCSSGSTSASAVSQSSSAAAYIQAAQKTRGLRRKGSSMFSVSGSIGSIDMLRSDSRGSTGGGPATPTKPGLHLTPIGLGVTTPSPTGPALMYPFASSSTINLLSTPPSNGSTASDSLDPPSVDRYRSIPPRLRQISNLHQAEQHGPILRASNPMLASTYNANSETAMGKVGKYGKSKHGGKMEKDFVLVQSLGSGAFSQVWKVRDKKNGKLWAVKAGKPYTGAKNRLRQLEEISILRQLSIHPHPNVMEYVDSWESRSRLYIRTSLADCGDLSRFLSLLGDFNGLGEARVWKTLVELASGLAHIHTHNFIHLDLKPSNILIDREGGLKIADFGMSVVCTPGPRGLAAGGVSPALPERDEEGGFIWSTPEESEERNQAAESEGDRLTPRMDVIPSPILDREVEGDREYLCPEALSEEKVGKAADVFSLGILVLEAALNVVLPSNGDGWIKLRNNDFSDLAEHYRPRPRLRQSILPAAAHIASAVQDDPAVPVEPLPMLSDELLGLVQKMMRSDPDVRATLDDIWENEVVRNVLRGKRGKALVEEEEGWLVDILDG